MIGERVHCVNLSKMPSDDEDIGPEWEKLETIKSFDGMSMFREFSRGIALAKQLADLFNLVF